MAALRGKSRTAETFLAELGIVGAVMAGALVVFLLVVAVVTFDAWPDAGGLFSSDDSTVEAGAAEDATPASSVTSPVPGSRAGAAAGPGKRGANKDGKSSPGSTGSPPSEGNSPSGGGGGGGGDPSPTQGSQGSQGLGQTVSGASNGAGNAINNTTGTNAGNAVSGAGNAAGNTITGLGL